MKKINTCDFLNFELCLFGLERNREREGGQIGCLLCVCVCNTSCDFLNFELCLFGCWERNGEGGQICLLCVCVCNTSCDFLNFELCLFGCWERNGEGGQICLLCVCVCVCVLKREKKISTYV
jgi:hypothetical protein